MHELRGRDSACYSRQTNILDFDGNDTGKALEARLGQIFSEIMHNTWKLKVIK